MYVCMSVIPPREERIYKLKIKRYFFNIFFSVSLIWDYLFVSYSFEGTNFYHMLGMKGTIFYTLIQGPRATQSRVLLCGFVEAVHEVM